MNETNIPPTSRATDSPLTDEQTHAMSRFMKNLGNASVYLVLLPGFILIMTGFLDLLNGGWPPQWLFNIGFRGAAVTAVLAVLYSVTLIVVIWKRIGLKWYLVGENDIGIHSMLIVFFLSAIGMIPSL